MTMPKVRNNLSLLVPELKDRVLRVNVLLLKFRLPMELFETGRTLARQKWVYDMGYSKTMESLHRKGKAADYVVKIDGVWSWDYKKYLLYYLVFGAIAVFCGLEWGGHWKSRFKGYKDYPHAQLKGKK